MGKKIVICTEDWAGSGHKMAATAIREALEEAADLQVRVVNGVQELSPFLHQLSRMTYSAGLRYSPRVWQRIYEQEKRLSRMFRSPLGKLLRNRLLQKVAEDGWPDVVVATHAYLLPAWAEVKLHAPHPFVLGSVFTDFHVNSFWVHEAIDFYVVAHDSFAEQLEAEYGISRDKIHPLGIPVRRPFSSGRNRQKREWKRLLGLREDPFTVLFCSGGGGMTDYRPVIFRLLQRIPGLQIVVIEGANASRIRQWRTWKERNGTAQTIRVLPFVDRIWEWIGAADAIVTKPGGITCAEALSMGTPMILYRPLPGQERRNSRFLQERGAAVGAGTIEQVVGIISRWTTERAEWSRMAESTRQLAHPDSAGKIAELILSL